MEKKAIAIMDSGLGGLTVMKKVINKLPHEDIVYIGDTFHCPYGTKEPYEILKYVKDVVQFLLTKNIKLLVVACNTATVVALPWLKEHLDIPVIGMIEAGSEEAALISSGKIGVIATKATVDSLEYTKKIKQFNKKLEVYEKACPSFVEIVENGLSETKIAYDTAAKYLKSLKQQEVDTLILGCTHFPMMKNAIKEEIGDVKLVDPANYVVKQVIKNLENNNLKNKSLDRASYELYITKEDPLFDKLAHTWLETSFMLEEVNLYAK